ISSSHFTSWCRKDLRTEMIRTKLAHRKSLSQKQNRHKEYEPNRCFALKDINIPTLESRILIELDETSQVLALEKANVKSRSMKTVLCDQRKQMLQKYKEKQLQKLEEQREKAKTLCAWFSFIKPECYAEPQRTISSLWTTRSKAKDLEEQTKINNESDVQQVQPGQRQTSEKKVLDKRKVIQLVAPPLVRMTLSAAEAAKQVAGAVSSPTARKPLSRATGDNEPGRQAANKETKSEKDISCKTDGEENTLDSQTIKSTANVLDSDGDSSKMENLPKTNLQKMKGKNSFAPQHFMCQPLDGLKTYQVTPMTPRNPDAFLISSYTWISWKTEDDKTQKAKERHFGTKCKMSATQRVQQDSDKLQHLLGSLTVFNDSKAITKKSNGLLVTEVSSLEMKEGQISQLQHHVPYFRNTLHSEIETLRQAAFGEKKLEMDLPDDAKDLIFTAVGQIRLLMKERFKQFEGPVNDCEYKRGAQIWMISFQIEHVNKKVNNLTKLEECGWQNNNNASKKNFRKKIILGIVSKPKRDDGGRIAGRNCLAVIKIAMRDKIKQEEHAETAASVIPKEVDKIVFGAGFFRVESPSEFQDLASPFERPSQSLRTPKSVSKAVSQSRGAVSLLGQTAPPESSSPWSTKNEHDDRKTLFTNIPESGISMGEDARGPGLQDLIEAKHDDSKINFETDYLSSERMSLPLAAGGVADNIHTDKKRRNFRCCGKELNSSITSHNVLMTIPEKWIPSQNMVSQEEETKLQSVLLDNKSLTTECHLVDSTGLNCSNPFTQLEGRHQAHPQHLSLRGDLVTFSPLRPPCGEQ
uniref:Uncharacterized protein n=1 Tax=Otolemur garnettii TaxID=30611 RepID=H0XS42_OTOGA